MSDKGNGHNGGEEEKGNGHRIMTTTRTFTFIAYQRILSLKETVKTLRKDVTKIQTKFEINNQRTNNLLSQLTSKIPSLRELQPLEKENNARLSEEKTIRNENSALKSKNKRLKEGIEVVVYTLSDLNDRIKVADQEKQSLLTAIRLIYGETKVKLPDSEADQQMNSVGKSEEVYVATHF